MKKKILLTLVMVVVFALTFVLMVSAATHAGKEIDINATVTLDNGTVCNLFDSEGNALTWYLDANGELQSIRTDDQQMWWKTESWDEVTSVGITFSDGTTVDRSKFVVVNMMDDDVVKNNGATAHFGKPVTNFKHVFNNCPNLEYLYLRLDTTGFFQTSFTNAKKLKYVNIEELTLLTNSRGGQQFSGCTSLFEGQILDLSNTKLIEINGGGIFAKVPIKGLILPTTFDPSKFSEWAFQENPTTSFVYPDVLTSVYNYSFKNCANLQTVYLYSSITSVGKDAFLNCSKLEKVFFAGTKTQLEAMLANTDATGNNYFLALKGENNANIISYEDYKKLEDKSGKYMVYDVSTCVYSGEHGEINLVNPCVGACSVCGERMVKHATSENISVKVEYSSFASAGTKTVICNNEGCGNVETSELSALLVCRGYSAPENEDGRFAVVFDINESAIEEYATLTGKTVKLGVFAVLQSKLGDNDVLGENGALTCNGIKAEVAYEQYTSVELKLSGFETDEHKALTLAMGAYVDVDGEYSYIQAFAPEANAKYSFVSYNDVVNAKAE